VTQISFQAAKDAVSLAIGLIGVMALWLGLVRVAEVGGLMHAVARCIRPLMTRLFPDIPPQDPAMSAMALNMAANALGLGNAATPLGIKAMIALNRLNPLPGRATDAMCLFLAINTSNVTILPLGVIGVRAAAGAADPAAILVPSVIATTCSTVVAVIAATMLARVSASRGGPSAEATTVHLTTGPKGNRDLDEIPHPPSLNAVPRNWAQRWLPGLAFFTLGVAVVWHLAHAEKNLAESGKDVLSHWIIPALMLAFVSFGFRRGVSVYEAAAEGAREGFQVAVRLIPFLVMILVAIGIFRASGAFDILAWALSPITSLLRIPAEVLPVALLRPLSGSGAFGLMSEITARDPDGFAAYLAGTIQGSTETTFYVLAVYFGAVGIRQVRHGLAAALLADLAGFLAAVAICHWSF
jgi:spore maturation protein SpmA